MNAEYTTTVAATGFAEEATADVQEIVIENTVNHNA